MEDPTEKTYLRHRGLIRALINSIVVNNTSVVDTQDLQQVGAMALVLALKTYDPSLGSLPSYIRKCVRNALLEQANSFSGVFTTDERVRRQANAIRRLKLDGLSDKDIMSRLGIRTQATFNALLGLIDGGSIDLDSIELPAGALSMDEDTIHRMLDEIGLDESEMEFVNLVTTSKTVDEIMDAMELSRTSLYAIKASVKDKILSWGQDN
jgi:DNA-directed RNA polymerase specialized sigma subunit